MTSDLKHEIFERELASPLQGHALTRAEEFVANLLLAATSQQPIGIKRIVAESRVSESLARTLDERTLKGIIRTLRKRHAFPIIARRMKPAGYWWCGSADEMEQFIESFKSQALDELHTIGRMVRHNYPELVGQLRLEDVGQEVE